MKPITVVGAGFSGLTLAFELSELGLPVVLVDKESRPGGMLNTLETEHGLVETAANAVIANADIEELFSKLQLTFAQAKPERRKRFIFWNRRPRRWPLGFLTTLRLIAFLWRFKFKRSQIRPLPAETVGAWAKRLLNAEFETRLLSPALQGIYAAEAKDLSASLVLGRVLSDERPTKKRLRRGSVAPSLGMGQWMKRLADVLRDRGVKFQMAEYQVPIEPEGPLVICTSAWDAAKILKPVQPDLAQTLEACKSLPLLTATLFFAPQKGLLKGFGCLFPVSEGFNSLGVLFNDSIFAGRSAQRSETWILGGMSHAQVLNLNDDQVLKEIFADRARVLKSQAPALSWTITRWPKAIPHYSLEWEKALTELKTRSPIYLHGNYLGALGLAQIHQRSKRLALELKERYG